MRQKAHTKPVVVNAVVKSLSSTVDAVDTEQERSSTKSDTPTVARTGSKSLAFICKEHASDQTAIATQLNFDTHKSMHSATDDTGKNTPFSAETLSLRLHLSQSESTQQVQTNICRKLSRDFVRVCFCISHKRHK